MIVLGIDTSAYANAIGIVRDGRVLADTIFEARTDSLQKILVNIEDVLKSADLKLADINGFGVGLGPGSWTGIRVGVTVGKILAYSRGKPACGVPTLAALALDAGAGGQQVCSVISVGTKDTVYAACYRGVAGGVTRLGDYYVGDIAGLAGLITEPTVLAGPGVKSYGQLSGHPNVIGVKEGLAGGAVVARLAARRFERGDSDDALALSPLYLKESTAKAFLSRYSQVKA
jgi:tRNA threonylcarbamoyladenosine biosynthesis protein TsaB